MRVRSSTHRAGPEAEGTHALLKPSSIPPVSELYMALVRLTLRLTRSERGGRLPLGMTNGPASSGKGDDTAADMIVTCGEGEGEQYRRGDGSIDSVWSS